MPLNYNEVFHFMQEFGADYINKYGELIIDHKTNTYVTIKYCKDLEDVKTYVVFALCRPIGKGLDDKDAKRLLQRVNNYFNVNLSRYDMYKLYSRLCDVEKLEEFKDFINRGFPIDELKDTKQKELLK